MVRDSVIKITSLIVILSLNWAGLSAVGETVAYLLDDEGTPQNSFTASTLDFGLSSLGDFSPEVTPSQSTSRDIVIANLGILGFQYSVQAANFDGALCNYLNLDANLDSGISEYASSLTGFSYNAGQFSDPEAWQFIATLTSSDPALENETCTFDFIFDGVQIGGSGFYDQEIASSTITAGEWTTPTTSSYSPIADSYVNEKSPNSNYGSSAELEIRSKNCPNPMENKRTYIKFDFNFPAGTIINSAYLKLYMKDGPSEERIYEARRVSGFWKERDAGPGDGVDWNNQPGVYATSTVSVLTGDSNPKWLSWDVTDSVQGFVAETYPNYGWQLKDSIESEHTAFEGKFSSRENNDPDKRPILEVTFTPPEISTDYVVINEVYYDVGSGKGNDPNNEWVEIYNPTNSIVDISGWKLCDNNNCDTIPLTALQPKGFAVASGKSSTWDSYWTLPAGTITIDLPGDKIGGNGLNDSGDRVVLRDAFDAVVDSMSYGDDNSQLDPSVPLSGKGKSLARIVKGYDTDSAADWVINATPNPGTNPSVGGIETISFTYQGIEFLGGELAPEEDIFNDSPETEDRPTDIILEEETVVFIDDSFIEPIIDIPPFIEEIIISDTTTTPGFISE